MELYGKKLTKSELRKRVGNMDQVAGIRLVQMDDGNERPGRAALFSTGSGLDFTVLLDRGMDIAHASYLGMPMGWRSSTGDVAPQYFEPEGARWLRSFYGGLLTTCGLMNVGSPPEDTAVSGQGIHGRIGNLPARDLKVTQEWRGNDYVLEVTGTIRETRLFGENLAVTRTISTKLGDSRICLRDVLTNDGFDTQPFQLLYHCNIGWPALDAGSEIIVPTRRVAPRDADAADGKENWHKIGPPVHGFKEQVYYHDMAPARDGFVTCAVVNKAALKGNGFGVYVRYDGRALPRFTHWKNAGEGAYITGLEPCTCGVEGWAEDEKRGWLHKLRPGQSREIRLEFGPVTTAAEVKKLRALCPKGPARFAEHCSEFVKKPV